MSAQVSQVKSKSISYIMTGDGSLGKEKMNVGYTLIQLAISVNVLLLATVAPPLSSSASAQSIFHKISQDSTAEPLCSLDSPNSTVKVRSLLDCASQCEQSLLPAECSFNFKANAKSCETYFTRPGCFLSTPQCSYYQTFYAGDTGPSNVLSGISAPNCSFPFTYSGALFYSCTLNLTSTCGNNDIGCFVQDRIWKTCTSDLNFEAQNGTVNVSIPIQRLTIPLPSVHAWIIWHQRINANFTFNRLWVDYQNGFGTLSSTTDFWLGLDIVNELTTGGPGGPGSWRMRAEFQSLATGNWYSAEYEQFWIDDEAHLFTLHVSRFSGDAGDGFNYPNPSLLNNGMNFSTTDSDNDYPLDSSTCAINEGGGWWFNNCSGVCFTCTYGAYFSWVPLETSEENEENELGLLATSRMLIMTNV